MKKLIGILCLMSLMAFKAPIYNSFPLQNNRQKITLEIDSKETYLRGEEVFATFYIENNSDEKIYILKPTQQTTNLDFFSVEIECGLQFASTSDGTTYIRTLDDLVLIKPNTKEKFTIHGSSYSNLTCVDGPEDKFKLQLTYNYEASSEYWVAKYKEANPENYEEIDAKVFKGKIVSKMTLIPINK